MQEEERADLARDLHDEVSPFLFSVDVDASTIREIATGAEDSLVSARADAIRDAVAHMKKKAREVDPEPAAADGASRSRPQERDRDAGGVVATAQSGRELQDRDRRGRLRGEDRRCHSRYRAEAISNALKHGKPEEIDVIFEWAGEESVTVVVRDDGGGLKPASLDSGFGLIAMRERTEALGETGDGAEQNRPRRGSKWQRAFRCASRSRRWMPRGRRMPRHEGAHRR